VHDTVYFIAAYGICFGLMNDKSSLVARVRRVAVFDRMFQCAYCTGFHAGWVVWVVRGIVSGFPSSWVVALAEASVWALASAAACYGVDAAVCRLERGGGQNHG
jgi:hypothetical protein